MAIKNGNNFRYNDINNNEIRESSSIHPLSDMKNIKLPNKNDIHIKNFCKDLNVNFNSIIKKSNKIFSLTFNNVDWMISLEPCDGGGNDRTNKKEKMDNPRKKIEIPFANNKFKELIKNNETILVINVYIPLKNEELDYGNRVYAIVEPEEIYNSKSLTQETWNSSSRWIELKKILQVLNEKIIVQNNSKNLFICNRYDLKMLISNEIKSKYLNCYNNNLLKLVDNWLEVKDMENDLKKYQKFRNIFREKLLLERGWKCEIFNCEVGGKNLLNASHIKPVHSIVHDTRMDKPHKIKEIMDSCNGFLFCPNHDRLFDRFLISFTSGKGEVLISDEVKHQTNYFNLIDMQQTINIIDKNMSNYLIFHNDEFFKRNYIKENQNGKFSK
ncbi:HNH endonuclease signature motif containing protein [Spiroplasma endosymbiont of Amphibalanus improvisus]|uniref:HNH endonuclease signature motif containing protein n=1 Tax=Spiroplasma endosymbiont of Amphibalanus improvisus TaxID=3066327 RepID=UPI00313AC96F